MKKFKCNSCEADCELTMQMDELTPSYCLYDKEKANWHEVVDSAENAHTTSEQLPSNPRKLPDWVKVGGIGYDNKLNEYFEITNIDNDTVVVKFIRTSGCFSYKYFKEFCSEANKRPFNEKEMREIVGKSLETPGFVKFIFSYDKENKTLESYDFLYTADDLFEDDFKFEGKPCYKLEHLNEKGEWVE